MVKIRLDASHEVCETAAPDCDSRLALCGQPMHFIAVRLPVMEGGRFRVHPCLPERVRAHPMPGARILSQKYPDVVGTYFVAASPTFARL